MRNIKAFTLVELIVVITILAILWTIWFLSFTWYAREAKISSKKSDINGITRKINLLITQWENALKFAANTWSVVTWNNIQIWWFSSYNDVATKYVAGDIDYLKVWIEEGSVTDEDFWDKYKYGATTHGWKARFQIAATIETWAGIDTIVSGNWSPRTSADTTSARDKIVWNIFYISGTSYQEAGFMIWDLVQIASGTGIIVDLKNNTEVHLDSPITTPGANIFLDTNESRHLIKNYNSNWPIDIWRTTNDFTPYN